MKQFSSIDLEAFALGTAVLGSGGGGDPTNPVLMSRYALEQYGPVALLSVADLKPDDLIVPIAMMGAPLVMAEKLTSGQELSSLVGLIEKTYGRKPTALLAAEIGGANAFSPLLIAGRLGLPILDADIIGRAFPQLQMSSANLFKIPCCPAFLGDSMGNAVVIHTPDVMCMERLGRHVAMAMGSICAISIYIMDGDQAKRATVSGTVSQAISIGKAMLQARNSGTSPIDSVLKKEGGVVLVEGTISDVNQRVAGGFLEGTAKIGDVELVYQNEYLLARREQNVLATTPDILMVFDTENGTPITSEALRYGLRVSLVALPSPQIWTSEEGLALVGPRFFGFDTDYHPIKK